MNKIINDLPEELLVEILVRLASNKHIFQCKCVSKRWQSLISTPYFVSRYLRLQSDLQKPVLTTLVAFDTSFRRESEYLLTSSDQPVFQRSNLDLSFLPCYRDPEEIETLAPFYPWRLLKEMGLLKPGGLVPPAVIGTYKDLVLCSNGGRDKFYLCNPYTKQWTAIPPRTTFKKYGKMYDVVLVGCDPYYYKNLDDDFVTLNVDCKWKIIGAVRENDGKYHLEMFSSDTREWKELAVLNQRWSKDLGLSPVLYNRKVYWLCRDGCVFELDLDASMSNNDNVATCRFIEVPEDACAYWKSEGWRRRNLIVSGGRLRLFIQNSNVDHPLKIWELKQVVKDDQSGKFKWLADYLTVTFEGIPLRGEYCYISEFHKNNEDVVYICHDKYILTCNIRGGRLKKAARTYFHKFCLQYTYVLPWWPTPIHKLS